MNAIKANNTIGKVRGLQRKLYLAAKLNSKRRFHALYNLVYRKDILLEAWKRVKANGGSSGIDGITIEAIEEYGIEKFILEIQQELIEGRYRPKAVRRVYIPKGNGEKRPLGIPVIKDRVVQMAVKIVIEPLFEADFKDTSYGFRPKRNAHQALDRIRKDTSRKGLWVVDADIKGYFNNINYEKLMLMVRQRISDRRMLKMIWKWLRAGIIEKGEFAESEIGSPQGGVISPLLANIYLHYLDSKWEIYCKHLGKLVRYCDDFVVICKTKKEAGQALKAIKAIKAIMNKLELELHTDKTKVVGLWDGKEGFDFLGFHHRRKKSETSKGYKYNETYQFPSAKAMKRMKENIKSVFAGRKTLKLSMQTMIKALNPKIVGMRNYYGLKNAKNQLKKVDWYIIRKFTIWHNKKTQKKWHYSGVSEVEEMIYKNGLHKLAV